MKERKTQRKGRGRFSFLFGAVLLSPGLLFSLLALCIAVDPHPYFKVDAVLISGCLALFFLIPGIYIILLNHMIAGD